MRAILTGLLAIIALAAPVLAEKLTRMDTGTASRGWEAVGRLNLDGKGFCTGALIAPDVVLTAAHCLHDRRSGERIEPARIEFLAGWRNGRAAAYRKVRKAVAHPGYVFTGADGGDVRHDLALIRLDQPIRLPSIRPFATGAAPAAGAAVGVVSYARDRAEAPSIERSCHVLRHQPGSMVLSCDVDFGASGAPVFDMQGDEPRVVSVVAAKAEMTGQKVALGTDLAADLDVLLEALAAPEPVGGRLPQIGGAVGAGHGGGGARFLRPLQQP
jgi:protease YdgD